VLLPPLGFSEEPPPVLVVQSEQNQEESSVTRDEMAGLMADVLTATGIVLTRDGPEASVGDLFEKLRERMAVVHDGACDDSMRAEAAANCRYAVTILVLLHATIEDKPRPAAFDQVREACEFFRESGQKEYAHETDNAFANFERIAAYLAQMGLTREAVLIVYLEKHLDGIRAWIDGHRSQREAVFGRICDAIVYLCLLIGMFRERIGETGSLEGSLRRIDEEGKES